MSDNGYDTMPLGELADLYRQVWDQQDEAQKIADEHASLRNTIRNILVARMEAQGMDSLSTDRITLSVKEEVVAQVKDWTAVLPWIASEGKWELVRRQLNNAPFREMIERGDKLPDGLEPLVVRTLNNRRK